MCEIADTPTGVVMKGDQVTRIEQAKPDKKGENSWQK